MAVDSPSVRSDQEASRGIPADARKRYELLEDCRELVVSRLCKVINEALKKISDDLTESALKSGRREEQQAMMDAVSIVRQNRHEIEVRFRKAFIDCFERRLFSKPPVEAKENGAEIELSLVDDSVLSDQLAVDRLVHRTRGKLDPDEVLGIRARLAALLERDWFEEGSHPAAPEAVFEALKSALCDLAPKHEVQTALLDAFEPHVSANLNQVYTTVNDRLKSHRVLLKIRPQAPVNKSAPRRADGGEAKGGAAGASAATGAGGDAAGVMGNPMDALPVGAADFAGSDLAMAFNATMQQLAMGVPAARLSAARMLTDPATFGVADLPMPAAQPRLIDSITNLQVSTKEAPLASPQLLAELVERARDKGSPLDQLTVEIVSLVFDYIYADKRLADVIKQQLLRLQVVAVKAALLDRSFFARRQHPMRRLIDRISELATDPDTDVAPQAPIVKGLEELVEWILANFDQDLAAFAQALERLEGLAAEEAERRAARLAQLTLEAERADALASAREQAMTLLLDRSDESSPEFVRRFLKEWWSLAMARASVSDDPAVMRAADALQVAEALIWSVAAKLPEEISRLASLLPRLITGLMRGLKMIEMPDAPREVFFNELLRVHTKAIEAAKQSHPQRTAGMRAVSRIRMRSDGSIQYTPPRQGEEVVRPLPAPAADEPSTLGARAMLAADVQRGDRIEVDEEGETKRFKLAWISPSQKLYILSRFPDEARSLNSAQFAALFESGKARVVERRSTVDRAIDMIATTPKNQNAVPAHS